MALYAIADTHLSFGTDKPMDSFPGWSDYTARLAANWRHLVEPQDTVVIAGRFCLFERFARAKNLAQGQSRLLVEHQAQNGSVFAGKPF